MTSTARYDNHADWYIDYTRDWGSASLDFLPDNLTGQRVLDLACGWGQLSRPLAARGARVTGVDLSTQLINRAQEIESDTPAGISYLVGNATKTDWWDGVPYRGVVCNMALMDVDDLAGLMSAVTSVLEPGGWFVFTLFHPCFPGTPDDLTTKSSWPPDRGYAAEGWWTTGEAGVRGHVGAYHRMLSTYLNAALRAGFSFEEFHEVGDDLPLRFIARCRN